MTARYSAKRAAGRSPLRRRVVIALCYAAAALVGALIGVVTLALLSSNTLVPGGVVKAGDLNVTVGTMSWQQTTPGVTTPGSGTLSTTPSNFTSMPGDVIELTVPVTTKLVGDNLIADMSVHYDSPDAGTGVVSATFRVEDSAGAQVAPASGEAAANTTLTIPGLLGGQPGTTAIWTVVVTVDVLGGVQWVSPTNPAQQTNWNPGTVRVDLNQVRPDPSGPGGP